MSRAGENRFYNETASEEMTGDEEDVGTAVAVKEPFLFRLVLKNMSGGKKGERKFGYFEMEARSEWIWS